MAAADPPQRKAAAPPLPSDPPRKTEPYKHGLGVFFEGGSMEVFSVKRYTPTNNELQPPEGHAFVVFSWTRSNRLERPVKIMLSSHWVTDSEGNRYEILDVDKAPYGLLKPIGQASDNIDEHDFFERTVVGWAFVSVPEEAKDLRLIIEPYSRVSAGIPLGDMADLDT